MRTAMARIPRWSTDSLDHLPHGTGRIESVEAEDGATILGLQFHDRSTVELRVDALPDRRTAARELGPDVRPLAVLVTVAGGSLSFSLLASTYRGPSRLRIRAGTALWLLRSGRHGVVRCGPAD